MSLQTNFNTETNNNGRKIHLLDFPEELTEMWVEYLDDLVDLLNLLRMGSMSLSRQITMRDGSEQMALGCWACYKGDLDLLRTLVKIKQIDVNGDWYLDQYYCTVSLYLYIAINNQHFDVVKALVEEFGALVNQVDRIRVGGMPSTPLKWALFADRHTPVSGENRFRIIKLLLEHGAELFPDEEEPNFDEPDYGHLIDALIGGHISLTLVKQIMAPFLGFHEWQNYWDGAINYYRKFLKRRTKMPTAFTEEETDILGLLTDLTYTPDRFLHWEDESAIYAFAKNEARFLPRRKQNQHMALVIARYNED